MHKQNIHTHETEIKSNHKIGVKINQRKSFWCCLGCYFLPHEWVARFETTSKLSNSNQKPKKKMPFENTAIKKRVMAQGI